MSGRAGGCRARRRLQRLPARARAPATADLQHTPSPSAAHHHRNQPVRGSTGWARWRRALPSAQDSAGAEAGAAQAATGQPPAGRCRLTGLCPHQAPPVVEARRGLHEGQLQEVQARRRRDRRPPPHQRVHNPSAAAMPARQVGLRAKAAPDAQRQRRAGRPVRDARRCRVRRQVAPARARASPPATTRARPAAPPLARRECSPGVGRGCGGFAADAPRAIIAGRHGRRCASVRVHRAGGRHRKVETHTLCLLYDAPQRRCSARAPCRTLARDKKGVCSPLPTLNKPRGGDTAVLS